jgi:uncharacterized protein (DUF305 family)
MKTPIVIAELLLFSVIASITVACSPSQLRARDSQPNGAMGDMPAMASHDHPTIARSASSPPKGPFVIDSSKSAPELFDQSMAIMSRDMMATPMTGDPDRDFATMMIPHHQGAIDMAKVELLYGKDAVLRRLAQEIIVTQKSEIDLMRRQLDVMNRPASRHERRPR